MTIRWIECTDQRCLCHTTDPVWFSTRAPSLEEFVGRVVATAAVTALGPRPGLSLARERDVHRRVRQTVVSAMSGDLVSLCPWKIAREELVRGARVRDLPRLGNRDAA